MKSDDLVFDIDDIQPLYQSYHMITNTIAIGDHTSSYELFDVIFNFNYPQNGATLGKIHMTETHSEKIIYTIGLLDTTVYNMELLSIFTELGPYLAKSKGKRILFHCYAGISRSSTAAIMYFMMTTCLPLETIFKMIQSKRSIIDPNPAFRYILHICNNKRHIRSLVF